MRLSLIKSLLLLFVHNLFTHSITVASYSPFSSFCFRYCPIIPSYFLPVIRK
jgi:hypothetical protein